MRAADSEAPVADGELAGLFGSLAGTTKVAVAVSGGADSLALLDCLDRWRRAAPERPQIVVLTVDHGLRPESAGEAAGVAALAAARGLAARHLTWTGPFPATGIEAAARAARYRLLLSAARDEGASHLLLAHHRDDQAETFLMRLSRGSGVFGLAAMRREVRAGPITIVRPLLHLPRSRLAATTAAAGLAPVVDPMNADQRFTRARIRRLMPLLAGGSFGPAEIAAAAARFAAVADALDERASRLIAAAVTVDAFAVASIETHRFRAEPTEIRLRALTRILAAIGGEAYPPRSERLAALDRAIGETHPWKRTLAGAVIEARDGRLAVYREIGREPPAEIPLAPGFSGRWDHRFEVTAAPDAPPGLILGPLGESGRREVGAGSATAPIGALVALPALRLKGMLCAVPALSCWLGGVEIPVVTRPIVAERIAEPQRFPDA